MIFSGQFAIGFANVFIGRRTFEAQGFVIVLEIHDVSYLRQE
jgi:hypothetical protein